MYSNPQEDKDHLINLIDFLVKEVVRSGGDGDALWYSRYYDVKDLKILLDQYNDQFKRPYWKVRLDGLDLFYGEGQEGLVITNDESAFDEAPDWIQIKIRY